MNILFLGDIVSEAGLTAVCAELPRLQQHFGSELIIANGENIWDGKGPNAEHIERLRQKGVHVVTTGNHVWENWKSRPLLAKNPFVLRPHNYPPENEGSGIVRFDHNGIAVCVIQVQGRVYMPPIDCPFKAMDSLLESADHQSVLTIVDFHAEATAEKRALAAYLDGRVSLVIGTHTHVQTADAQILGGGTGFITDVGMCGPINSVLGMNTEVALKRFLLQTAHKYESAPPPIRISGVHAVIDTSTNKVTEITPFSIPEFSRS